MNAKLVWKGSGPARRIAVTKAVAQAALDTQVRKDTDGYVPFRTGRLADSPNQAGATVGEIRYDTPYAKRMYYGKKLNFQKAGRPLAGPFWFERSKRLWADKWRELVAKILGNSSGK